MSDLAPKIKISLVGCGVMGTGIAQVLATAGIRVTCFDRSDSQLSTAERSIVSGRFGLARAVDTGRLTAERAEATRNLLAFSSDLVKAVGGSHLVIEAIPEDLELKLEVFSRLGEVTDPDAVLASNTSGLPVAALAAAARRPTRVLAWHWASPAQVRPFAEIVRTARTDPQAVERVLDVARRCGKRPHVITENPRAWGFVANRVFFAAVREAEQVVSEGLADEETVDALMRDAFAWPCGPFQVLSGATDGWGDDRAGSLRTSLE